MAFNLGGLLGNLIPDAYGLSDDDKNKLARQGLLASGLATLAARNGGNVGQSLAQGLSTGLLAVNQGIGDISNQRYKNDITARTRQGMERNAAIEDAQRGVLNPDNSINEESWGRWAKLDPVGASEFRQKAQPAAKWDPMEIPYRDPASGRPGYLTVLRNVATQELRDLNGNLVSTGMQPQQPQGMLAQGMGQMSMDPSVPSAGMLSPNFFQQPDSGSASPQMPVGGLLGQDVLPGLEQAVMQVESGGNPAAVSSKGAVGTMQTMPGTLRDPGYGVVPARDQSPAEQERVGKDYLRAMHRQYGDPRLALAAYNWGPGNVDRAMQTHGGNVDAVLANAPAETRAYVPKVLAQVGNTRGSDSRNPQGRQSTGIGFRYEKTPAEASRQAPSGYRFSDDGLSLVPIPGGPADRKNNPAPGDLAQAEQALRKEYSAQIKGPMTIVNSYEQIAQAAKNPSAQNDLALIFSYMRMLDPTSVVREGEFANAQNAAGVPDQIRNAYNRAISGQRLNPDQRTGFVSSAKGLRDQAQAQIDGYRDQYSGLARDYNYSPERIVGSRATANEGAPRGSSVVPAAAIDYLRKNPGMRSAFEQKYGVKADDYLR